MSSTPLSVPNDTSDTSDRPDRSATLPPDSAAPGHAPDARQTTGHRAAEHATGVSALPAISLQTEGGFALLGSTFHTRLPAQAVPDPYLVCASPDALDLLGFSRNAPEQAEFLARFSGADASASSSHENPSTLPYASVYSGHQFGNWAGQLGDGRAVTLGEIANARGQRFDVQLKGSGLTPYSRMGDGRAVLRSSIREFLCSEAMDALGIPSTRALCVLGSDLPVRRETLETAAVVTRFAPSLIRFGHFEHFWSTGQLDALRTLADHVIDRFYPEARASANPYAELLKAVTLKTADMIAQWQAVGFCHGVMNTDNMSILGLTIDYGPFGFLDGFDAKHICNHTDQGGRYSYENQPQVGYWNLFCLAQALLPLIAAPEPGAPQPEEGSEAASEAITLTKAAVAPYKPHYAQQFAALVRAKLGLASIQDDDMALFEALLQLMQSSRADFTLTFRRLAAISVQGSAHDDPAIPAPRDLFLDREAFDAWTQTYRARLARETGAGDEADSDTRRRLAMNRVNPKYVLRNHLAETAIRAAREKDFSVTRRLLAALRAPFDEQSEMADLAGLPPDWAGSLEVSCSS